MNELDALSLAIKREKEAHRYYGDAAARSTNKNGKKMFSWLASEEMGHTVARSTHDPNGKGMFEKLSKVEQGHLDLLEEEYDWLSKSKSMFTLHRFGLAR